jgi:hypothetical protein
VIYLCQYLHQSLPDIDDDSDKRAQKAVAEIVRVRTAGKKVNVAAKAREYHTCRQSLALLAPWRLSALAIPWMN